ncbi:hypothetical protein [Pseudonocardia sp. ICBG601]|uniref:hypothetical protein n=1 Tax=Pseudonocardia sp. ICBG601 TaxID=2846759 RepID=UPI001CF6D7E9|nr:hypothetical protein [Pseudonocardia sp. ICBG601]
MILFLAEQQDQVLRPPERAPTSPTHDEKVVLIITETDTPIITINPVLDTIDTIENIKDAEVGHGLGIVGTHTPGQRHPPPTAQQLTGPVVQWFCS